MKTEHVIYGLFDPSNSELRYVGFTSLPAQKRLYKHINDSKRETTHKANWIKKLVSIGMRPDIVILQKTTIENWKEDEQWNIAYFKSIGCRLTNSTLGGDGTLGYKASPEQVERNSKSHSGKTAFDSVKSKISQSMKMLLENPEMKVKWSKAQMGRVHTTETKDKIGKTKIGKTRSKQTRNKISASKKGKKLSKNQKELLAEKRKLTFREKQKSIIEKVNELNQSSIQIKSISKLLNISANTVYRILNKSYQYSYLRENS